MPASTCFRPCPLVGAGSYEASSRVPLPATSSPRAAGSRPPKTTPTPCEIDDRQGGPDRRVACRLGHGPDVGCLRAFRTFGDVELHLLVLI
jgi:hypothetical protein